VLAHGDVVVAEENPPGGPHGYDTLNYFETADGHLALYLTQDYWDRFCATVDREAWADPDHRYGTNDSRLAHREELAADLDALFATATTEEWLDRFDAADGAIPAAPLNTIDEMVADPQVQAQGTVQVNDHPVMGRHWLPGVVPQFSETPGSRGHAPALGEFPQPRALRPALAGHVEADSAVDGAPDAAGGFRVVHQRSVSRCRDPVEFRFNV
jgi:crotonobetainyl-CoA:carnitine CoA-transferase CaiB-like acyl-CoA transferase